MGFLKRLLRKKKAKPIKPHEEPPPPPPLKNGGRIPASARPPHGLFEGLTPLEALERAKRLEVQTEARKNQYKPDINPRSTEFSDKVLLFWGLLRGMEPDTHPSIEGVLDKHFSPRDRDLFLPVTKAENPSLWATQQRNAEAYHKIMSTDRWAPERARTGDDLLALKFTMLFFGLPVEPWNIFAGMRGALRKGGFLAKGHEEEDVLRLVGHVPEEKRPEKRLRFLNEYNRRLFDWDTARYPDDNLESYYTFSELVEVNDETIRPLKEGEVESGSEDYPSELESDPGKEDLPEDDFDEALRNKTLGPNKAELQAELPDVWNAMADVKAALERADEQQKALGGVGHFDVVKAAKARKLISEGGLLSSTGKPVPQPKSESAGRALRSTVVGQDRYGSNRHRRSRKHLEPKPRFKPQRNAVSMRGGGFVEEYSTDDEDPSDYTHSARPAAVDPDDLVTAAAQDPDNPVTAAAQDPDNPVTTAAQDPDNPNAPAAKNPTAPAPKGPPGRPPAPLTNAPAPDGRFDYYRQMRERAYFHAPSVTREHGIPLNAPPLEAILRTPSKNMPVVTKSVLTPSETAQLQKDYHRLRQVVLKRTAECPYEGCYQQFPYNAPQDLQKHLQDVHTKTTASCNFCDEPLFEHWPTELRYKHYIESHWDLWSALNTHPVDLNVVASVVQPMITTYEAAWRFCARCGRNHHVLDAPADRALHDHLCNDAMDEADRSNIAKYCQDCGDAVRFPGSKVGGRKMAAHRCSGTPKVDMDGGEIEGPFCLHCGLGLGAFTKAYRDKHFSFCKAIQQKKRRWCPWCSQECSPLEYDCVDHIKVCTYRPAGLEYEGPDGQTDTEAAADELNRAAAREMARSADEEAVKRGRKRPAPSDETLDKVLLRFNKLRRTWP